MINFLLSLCVVAVASYFAGWTGMFCVLAGSALTHFQYATENR